MSRVKVYLQDELNKLKQMEEIYQKRIQELPKGRIYYKEIHGKKYPYLQHRFGIRSKSQYIKNLELEALEKKIKERMSHEISLKAIREDINYIIRALQLK